MGWVVRKVAIVGYWGGQQLYAMVGVLNRVLVHGESMVSPW